MNVRPHTAPSPELAPVASRSARCRRAGARAGAVHDARRACAIPLVDLAVLLRAIMRILRHAQFGVTMEIYAKVSLPAAREALLSGNRGDDGPVGIRVPVPARGTCGVRMLHSSAATSGTACTGRVSPGACRSARVGRTQPTGHSEPLAQRQPSPYAGRHERTRPRTVRRGAEPAPRHAGRGLRHPRPRTPPAPGGSRPPATGRRRPDRPGVSVTFSMLYASSSSTTTPTGLTRASRTPGPCIGYPTRSPIQAGSRSWTCDDGIVSAASCTSTNMRLDQHR